MGNLFHKSISYEDSSLLDNEYDSQESQCENSSVISKSAYDDQSVSISSENTLKVLAQLYLKLKTKHHLTEISLQTITEAIYNINNTSNTSKLKEIVKVAGGIDMQQINKNILERDAIHLAHNPKDGVLRNSYNRNLFYKKMFSYVSPKKIYLGRNNNHGLCHLHYVPIIDTLSVLLHNEKFRHFITLKTKSNENLLADFCDGIVYKHNTFFQKNPSALQIILYQDSFEICNPIGSAKVKYKILGVYMILANLPPHFRSKVDNIQLVLLCFEKHVKQFGFAKILNCVIQDLKKIETEGIPVHTSEGVQIYKGSLIAVLGDNLGSHQIGGFTENFSFTDYYCRYCYAQRQDLEKGKVELA